jgi:simple sugar transport system ATP-binding protein
VADLPIGMQQRVEILKALYREAKILIFDEPTSVLTPIEVESFLEGMKQLREKGCTIIFITHKLTEVMAVADSVTVLRHGRVVAQKSCKKTNVNELARLMVDRDVGVNERRAERDPGKAVLKLNNISTKKNGGALALDNISLELYKGEILGVAGVDGNGQTELAEVITGLRPIDTGTIQASGTEIAKLSIEKRRWLFGIGFVPPDRQRTGLVLDYPAPFNLALRQFNHLPFSKNGILNFRYIRQNAEELIEKYDVRLHDLSIPVRSLSGGNQQKLILAREIEAHPKVLIAMQACKGLDIGATEFVQNTLADERDKGLGVLYISTELEHILEVADRIAVMCQGRITGILLPEQVTPERIGMLMAGVSEEMVTC